MSENNEQTPTTTYQPTDTLMSVTGVLAMIVGIFLCITIVGAIFGIPMIIASNFFRRAANMTKAELAEVKGAFLGWTIFLSIVGFPLFAILTIIAYTSIDKK